MSILEEMYIPAMMNSCRVKKNEETLFHQFGKHGDLICTRYFCTNKKKLMLLQSPEATLLHKRFVGAVKIAFLEADSGHIASFHC